MVLFYAVVTCAQVRTLCLHCATGEAGTPPLPAVRSQSSLYPRHAAFERWGLWGRVDDDSWRCEKCSGRPLRMATKVGKAPGGNVTFFGYGFPLWVSGSTDIAFVSISQKLTTKRNKIPQLKAVQKDANSQFSALDIDPDLCLQPAGENARSAHQWSDIFDTSARALKPWVLVSPSPVTVTEFLQF